MATSRPQSLERRTWRIVERQHGVIARRQLLELGWSAAAVRHRLERGRLHAHWPGVYAVGRPDVTREGRWMAAVLACGPGAVLSDASAAALWSLRPVKGSCVHVSTRSDRGRRLPGVAARRRDLETPDVVERAGIPVTGITLTLVDAAARERPPIVEAMVNEADKQDLMDPEALRAALERHSGRRGCGRLRALLDRRTFTLTDSELERRFRPLARGAGLPPPQTGRHVNGFKVDFLWPELGLVVETDGLRYHRTPAEQARDRLRDQAHAAAGLTPLRFTRAQVHFEPGHVQRTLAAVARRLAAATPARSGKSRPPAAPRRAA